MGRKLAIDFGGFIPVTSEIDQLFVLPGWVLLYRLSGDRIINRFKIDICIK